MQLDFREKQRKYTKEDQGGHVKVVDTFHHIVIEKVLVIGKSFAEGLEVGHFRYCRNLGLSLNLVLRLNLYNSIAVKEKENLRPIIFLTFFWGISFSKAENSLDLSLRLKIFFKRKFFVFFIIKYFHCKFFICLTI